MSRLNTSEYKNKNFQRIERLINNAFLSMFNSKELGDINVLDLCKEAGINRSTFYDHYVNIDSLYNKLYKEVFNNFTSWANNKEEVKEFHRNPKKCLMDKLDHLTVFQHKVLLSIAKSSKSSLLIDKLSDFFTEKIVSTIPNHTVKDEIYYKSLLIGGIAHLFAAVAFKDYKYKLDDIIDLLSEKIVSRTQII